MAGKICTIVLNIILYIVAILWTDKKAILLSDKLRAGLCSIVCSLKALPSDWFSTSNAFSGCSVWIKQLDPEAQIAYGRSANFAKTECRSTLDYSLSISISFDLFRSRLNEQTENGERKTLTIYTSTIFLVLIWCECLTVCRRNAHWRNWRNTCRRDAHWEDACWENTLRASLAEVSF